MSISAEITKFPKTRKEMIKALLNTASKLEKASSKHCVQIQNKVIVTLIEECNQPTRVAKAG